MVSHVLQALGYAVYDCDSHAKCLMDTSPDILRAIAAEISPDAVKDGKIDRPLLSKIVFSDPAALRRLNATVHGAVRLDLARWYQTAPKPCFVETAILRESGLDEMCDSVWHVAAPAGLRIARAMARSGMSADHARARVSAQSTHYPGAETVTNDDKTAILPQILNLLEKENGLSPDKPL